MWSAISDILGINKSQSLSKRYLNASISVVMNLLQVGKSCKCKRRRIRRQEKQNSRRQQKIRDKLWHAKRDETRQQDLETRKRETV